MLQEKGEHEVSDAGGGVSTGTFFFCLYKVPSHRRGASHLPTVSGKVSARQARDAGSNPGLGRFPGVGNGNPFQYSCLGNHVDVGAWWLTVHGVAKSWTWLSDQTTSTPSPGVGGNLEPSSHPTLGILCHLQAHTRVWGVTLLNWVQPSAPWALRLYQPLISPPEPLYPVKNTCLRLSSRDFGFIYSPD